MNQIEKKRDTETREKVKKDGKNSATDAGIKQLHRPVFHR